MPRALRNLPHDLGWMLPLLCLPLVAGAVLLETGVVGRNPGSMATLVAGAVAIAWYLLAAGLAWQHFSRSYRQRRALRRLSAGYWNDDSPEWIVDASGTVLAETAGAVRERGEFLGRPVTALLAGRVADVGGAWSRSLARAARAQRALIPAADCVIALDQVAEGLFRLAVSPQPLAPEDSGLDHDRLPFALLRISAEGTILSANPASRIYCGENVRGQHLSAVFDGLGRPFDDWLAECQSGRGPDCIEVLRARQSRSERFIQVSLLRDPAADGTLLALLTDARAVKTLEAQFVQSQKMQAIGQLAGGIAHDFNNLLTAISGHCDLLMLRHDRGDPDYADLAEISQNANRAANLVGQLLAFSRKQTLNPEILDMRDTISDLTYFLNRLIGETVTLEVDHGAGLSPVRADRGKIEQVLMNLVVNARDAMKGGGRIRISTEDLVLSAGLVLPRFTLPAGHYVLIRVEDEGEGIAEQHMTKIFEPFFTTKGVGEGTGLGLATVYGIVKQTGGYILCDSTPGEGTVFSIYLPAHDGPIPAASAGGTAAAAGLVDRSAPRRILLVEDEVPVRTFASRALRMHGFEVIEAGSGEDALSLLADERVEIELIMSDVVMPGLDGPSWVRLALKDRPSVRVIFMSGYTEDVFEDGRNRIEGAGFLQKPFSLAELVARAGERLGMAQASDA